jgi:exonuclease SbcC
MLPVKLFIEGLQSYAERVEIDFERFYKNKLFGIFGDTGAGKSTILDAIILALYGKTPRLGKSLQEAINPSKDKIRISFVFKMKDKKYLVERIIGKDAGCRLYELRENIKIPKAEKIRESENKIKEIVGLEYDEFCKVVILPQNQFAEILKINPSERAELLGNLFDLNVFGEPLFEIIKKRMNEIELQKSSAENRFSEIKDVSEESLKNKEEERNNTLKDLEECKKEFEETSKRYEILKKFVELNKKKKEIELSLNQLKEKRPEIEKLKEKIKNDEELSQFKPLYFEWNNLESSIKNNYLKKEEIEKELNKISEELNKILKKKYDFDNTFSKSQEDLIRIKKEAEEAIKINDKIEKLKNEEKEIKKKILFFENEILKIEKEIQNLQNEIEKLNREITNNQKQLEKLELNDEEENLYNVLPSILPKYKEVKELELEIKKFEKTCDEEKNKKELFFNEIKEKIFKKLQIKILNFEEIKPNIEERKKYFRKIVEEKTKDLEDLQYENMAIVLSKRLQEGMPCPVCGSEEHPRPASGDVEEKIKNLKKEIENLKNKIEEIENFEKELSFYLNKFVEINTKINQMENDLKEKREKLKRLKDELFNIFHKEPLPDIEELFNKLKERKGRCEKIFKNLNFLKDKYNEKNSFLNTNLQKKVEFSTSITNLKEQIKKLNEEIFQNIEELNQKTKGKNPQELKKEAEEKLKFLEDTKKSLENSLKEKEQEKINKELELQKIKTTIENEERRYKEIEKNLKEKAKEKGVSIYELKNFFLDEKTKEKFKKEIEEHENKEKSKLGELHQVEKQIEELQVKEVSDEEIEKNEKVLKENKEKIEKLSKKIGALEESIKREKELLKEKNQLIEKINNLEKEFKNIKILENLLKGKEMVKFLLTYLIKDIVHLSNQILEGLIGKRFYLNVSEKLEFTIKDLFYNSIRSVATLSGGETFIVSFSLALALSYYIQNRRKKTIQFFFIDEGFSSLDEELRDSVYVVLNELRSQDRLVGLISHLTELKQFIPEHIYVYKDRRGISKIKYSI